MTEPATTTTPPADIGGVSGPRLQAFIERIERLEAEKAELAADIRDVYAEAKGTGFDPKIMRTIVKLRKLTPPDRAEQDELIDLYRQAVGV